MKQKYLTHCSHFVYTYKSNLVVFANFSNIIVTFVIYNIMILPKIYARDIVDIDLYQHVD